MEIMIDNQKVVEVEVELVTVDGDEHIVLDISQTHTLLDAWLELDPAHRKYGWSGNHDEEDLIIAWSTRGSGSLTLEWVSAFFDGRDAHDAHSLAAINSALPIETLKWGVDL